MGLVPELDSPTLYELTGGNELREVFLAVGKQTERDGIKWDDGARASTRKSVLF